MMIIRPRCTSGGKGNRHLVPQQFSAAAYDYLPTLSRLA